MIESCMPCVVDATVRSASVAGSARITLTWGKAVWTLRAAVLSSRFVRARQLEPVLKRQLSPEQNDVLGRPATVGLAVERRALECAVKLDVGVGIPVRPDRERFGLPARAGGGQIGDECVPIDGQRGVARHQLERAPGS